MKTANGAGSHLLYVANSSVPSRAANTVGVLNMCSGFVAAGADVELIARGCAKDAENIFAEFGLPHPFALSLVPYRWGILDKLAFVSQVRKKVAAAAKKGTLVFGRSSYGLLFGVPAGRPFIYDSHAFPDRKRDVWLEHLLLHRKDLLFVTTTMQPLADEYERAHPHLRGRVFAIPNGAPLARPPSQIVHSGGRQSNRLQVYYVGHLYAGRGVEQILDLARVQPDMDFHIVGGEDEDIRHHAARAPQNVTFHGYVPPGQLPEFYDKADVCISPHQRRVAGAGGKGDIAKWTSPLKLFEYMSHSKPIVASSIPAITQILTDGEDALLCPPGDLEAWGSALRKLRDDPALRHRLSEASFKNASTRYSWRRRAALVLEKASLLMPSLT